MPSLAVTRAKAVEKLLRELDRAQKRLEATLAEKPLLSIEDFGSFLDGSRENDHGNHREWTLGRISGRRVYFCSPWSTDPDTLSLLVEDVSSGPQSQNYVSVTLEDIAQDSTSWPLDALVKLRKRLKRFYTPRDLDKRVTAFTDRMAHTVKDAYLSA